jgi:hypothetical protein
MDMSFVVAAPESVQAAAQGLAGIRETLAEAMASAAVPTTGVVAAAQDDVSAGIAAVFGTFGQEYQAVGAQAQAFHKQFVRLLNSGASAYLGTEIANAKQNLLNTVNGPVQGRIGQPIGGVTAGTSGGGVGAVTSGLTAESAALPVLGGVGLGSLFGGTPVGQSVNGAVSALGNGGAVSLLSGELGSGWQTLSGDIVALPASLQSLGTALVPGLLQTGGSTSAASVAGPYQTLFDNTVQNLQILGNTWLANPAPFLHQFIANQMAYAQTIAADIQYVIQNLPTVLANLPANIQAAIQAFLAFDPVPYIQQFIDNQIGYAQLIASSLQHAAYDFGTGLQALPAAFQSAFQALQTGDIGGAVGDIAKGFVNLFVSGVDVTSTGNLFIPPGLVATITPTGALGDLLPILTIPGMMAQNFTNLWPAGSIPAQMSQNVTNVIDAVMDTSITASVFATTTVFPPFVTVSLTGAFGLPVALPPDAVGGPINTLGALNTSATAFVDAVQTGDWSGAAVAVIDAPAVVADGFLNGEMTLPLTFDLGGYPATLNIPLDGVLVGTTPYTASIDLGYPFGTITFPVEGTPISGLATGLLVYAPEQLALAIGATP